MRGQLIEKEHLAPYTSWRIGGEAAYAYWPADLEDLSTFLSSAALPVRWLGLGSNVLIPDEGVEGVVIHTHQRLDQMQLEGDLVTVGAGASCAKVGKYCLKQGLGDVSFLAGIPGTIGGALAMNAGAFGQEIWPFVAQVTTIDVKGQLHTRTPKDYEIGYRHVRPMHPEEWFVEAQLRLVPCDEQKIRQRIRELLSHRAATQPISQPSCGSVFTNPPGDFSARLIESVGLKGHQMGGVQISPRHANFMVNCGSGRASDVEALIALVQHRVHETYGICLLPEVRRW